MRYHCPIDDLKFLTADSTPSNPVELDGSLPITELIEPFRAWIKEQALGDQPASIKEWIFFFNRSGHEVKAESVLTHGDLATGHLMEKIEMEASKVAAGEMAPAEFEGAVEEAKQEVLEEREKLIEAKEEEQQQLQGLEGGGGGASSSNIDPGEYTVSSDGNLGLAAVRFICCLFLLF
jgi:hypothetical protein